MLKPKFTKNELRVIKKYNSPKKVQGFLDRIPYNFRDTFWSFRKVVKNKTANCFEGALAAASILLEHGYPPLIVCMEARDDIDHNIFVYKKKGKWGSIAISRDKELRGRKPIYRNIRALIMSYYPYYYNSYTDDRNDITLRGFSDPIDLRRFKKDWTTSGRNLKFIEEYLFKIPYKKLFPKRKELYIGTKKAKKNYYYSPE
ncbi:hypothetical protein KY360_07450 [Candidatus Woesearchaeota archaeon]|nr:hypothetical protein [Candidatus Woesearchaeota archaeon]